MALKSIKLNSNSRLLLIVGGLLCVLAVFFAVRLCFGHTIALFANSREDAEYASQLAPYDSQSYFRNASLSERNFSPDDFAQALENYEKAVSVSPNDFRLWMALGKARERNGDAEGAEKALRKSLELAPHYSIVHWTLGNILLRQGKTDEAFVEIRKAVDNDLNYANPAVLAAWQTFGGNIQQISQAIGDSTPIKAGLVPFLAGQQNFEAAYTFWNSIPENEKTTTYKSNGEAFLAKLLEAKKFREALNVQSQITSFDAEKFTVGSIFNGDFEKEVKATGATIFDWQIADGMQPQIGLNDSQKHGGNRSLVIVFNSASGQEFRSIQQTIAVESGRNYKLEAFYRSDLKAVATMKWEIVDASDGKILASTDAVVTNSAQWSNLSADFTTAPNTQAVVIRLTKVDCKQAICPISGRIWFDDISLK